MQNNIKQSSSLHMDHYQGGKLPYMCIESKGIHQKFIKLDQENKNECFNVIDASGGYSSACFGTAQEDFINTLKQSAFNASYVTDELYAIERASMLKYLFSEQGVWSSQFQPGAYHISGRSSGSEAIELALRLVFESRLTKYLKVAPEKADKKIILSFNNAWHGWTTGAMALNSRGYYSQGIPSIVDNSYGVEFKQIDYANMEHLRSFFKENGNQLLAVFVEPIQGDAGIIVPPAGFLRLLSQLCQQHSALLVADEILTFSKTGQFFAMADEKGPIPTDITVIGKNIGAGLLPTSLVIAKNYLHSRASGAVSTNDLRPFACKVIEQTVRFMTDQHLLEHSRTNGNLLAKLLKEKILNKFPHLFIEARGTGYLQCLELTRKASKKIVPIRCMMIESGVFVEVMAGGGNRQDGTGKHYSAIRVAPPLIATKKDIEAIVDAMLIACTKITQREEVPV